MKQFLKRLAEGVGFEPTLRFPVNTLSKRAPSATRPPLLIGHSTPASSAFLDRLSKTSLSRAAPSAICPCSYALLGVAGRRSDRQAARNISAVGQHATTVRLRATQTPIACSDKHIYVSFSNVDP